MTRPRTLGVQGVDPQRGALESQTEGRKIGVAPRRGGGGSARGALRWRPSMSRHRRDSSPCRRGRSDGMCISNFNPADSSGGSRRHPSTSAGHPAGDSAGQRRTTTGHRHAVTRQGATHRYRSGGQHHGTRPDLLAVPEGHHCQQQDREAMRLKSPSHHDVVMLPLLRLKRHRREAREFRAAAHRQSRPEGNTVTPHARIRVVP